MVCPCHPWEYSWGACIPASSGDLVCHSLHCLGGVLSVWGKLNTFQSSFLFPKLTRLKGMIEICLLFEYELIVSIFDKVMLILVKSSKLQDLLPEKVKKSEFQISPQFPAWRHP